MKRKIEATEFLTVDTGFTISESKRIKLLSSINNCSHSPFTPSPVSHQSPCSPDKEDEEFFSMLMMESQSGTSTDTGQSISEQDGQDLDEILATSIVIEIPEQQQANAEGVILSPGTEEDLYFHNTTCLFDDMLEIFEDEPNREGNGGEEDLLRLATPTISPIVFHEMFPVRSVAPNLNP